MRKFYSALRSAAVAAALLAVPASAQVIDVELDADAAPAPLTSAQRSTFDNSKTGPMAHVDAALRQAYAAAQTNAAGRGATSYVTVDAVATAPANVAALEAALVTLGFEPTGELGSIVSGYLPVSAIADAAALPALRSLMAPQYILQRSSGDVIVPLLSQGLLVGAVDGEASTALRADQAKAAFGIDGSGVLIGMMSDSYNALGGAAGDVATGDLPAGVIVLDDPVTGSDEGRAMMQLAYDVAPGVNFAFHTAFGGSVTFAQGIVDLFDAGSDIIVDDVSNSLEPFFQDGIIAQAVDYVVGEGVPYFSSAGNDSFASYEGDFADSGLDLVIDGVGGNGDLHNFNPGGGVDAFQNIVLPPGQRVRFIFGYDEPSVIASGIAGSTVFVGAPDQAPTSDYDVYILSTPSATVTGSNVLASSLNNNPLFGVPYEFVEYVNTTGATRTVYVAFTKFSGSDRRLKYRNFGGLRSALEVAEYNGAGTVFGHSNAAGAFATGAAAWFNTAAFSPFVASQQAIAGPAVANSFTSYGGLAIRLDIDGNRIAPDDRMKPNATASDGDNNTFFGGDSGVDADTNPNFFGTSAAAPNTSAVAALMLEAAGGPGTLSPQDVYDTLEGTAADLRPAPTYNLGTGPGYDLRTGFGFVVADQAVNAVVPTCSATSSLAFSDFDTSDDATFGEFASVSESGGSPVILEGCSFVVFDPFTENVTYSTVATGVIVGNGTYTFANMDGDQSIPEGTLPDGPGVFALLDGSASVGQSVGDVLSNADVVAAVVYLDEDNVFGQVSGGGSAAANAQALMQALGQLYATAGEEIAQVDLSVVTAPNPLSGSGTVSFGLAEAGPVTVTLYDALGRQVALLADAAYGPGRHSVAVSASALPAGVYVVRVAAEGEAQTARLTIVR